MTGLDVGNLAGCHRRDLSADMRKCRMAQMIEHPDTERLRIINRRESILHTLGMLMERWGKRLQRNGVAPASRV